MRAFILDSDEEEEVPRPHRPVKSRRKRQADEVTDCSLQSCVSVVAAPVEHSAPALAARERQLAPSATLRHLTNNTDGPVLKKARSGAPVAAGAAPVAAGVPAVPSKDSRWRKQARTPQEASGLAGSGGNGHPSQRLRVSGPYGGGPAEAPAAATEAAGEGKPPKPGRVAGSRKEGIAADGGTASTGPKLPPHDFFLKASQKRARREADAATARETARLAAVDQQRQHAEAKARLASGLQPHPFLAPRSRAVAGACAAPEGGAGACVAREGGAGVTLPLPPALPAIHVLQGQACEHGGAHAGWAHRRPATPPAWSTLASLREDVRGLEEQLAGVFMAQPGPRLAALRDESSHPAPDVKDAVPAEPADAPANALWTDKYRPLRASAVCGNQRSAAELRNWLLEWRPRRVQAAGKAMPLGSDSDGEWRQDSQELDSDEEACGLGGGAAWISGPVGSGKTAAVAAVADELGLQVLEVNPGSERTGALLTRAVGEATQSRRLAQASVEGGARTVVVFEEVDNLADADRGFLSALAALIAESKRPIVLVTNEATLPEALARARLRHLPFRRPAPSAAAALLARVCAAEGVAARPAALRALVAACCCDLRQSLLQAQVHLRSARPPPAAAQPHAALRALHQALSASAAGSAPTQPAAPAHPAQIDNPENGWQATRQASGAAELSPRSAPAGRAGQRRYAADGQVPESSGVAAMRASRTQADAAGSGYAGGGLRGSAQDGGAVAGLAGAGKPGAAGSACTDRRAGGAERGAPDLCALAVWAAVAWSAAADVLLQAAGAAEARADEDAAGLAALSCAPSGGVLSVAASALLDADFGRICTRPGTSCARPSCERRSAPRAAGEAAALPADGVAASRGGWVDPGRALSSDGTCVAAQAAAAAEAAWAATGGGAVAGRLTRGERLHAAARMAYLEHIREGADSCTAGGRVRRKRGFRSYVAATLALPADAVAGLTAVGSSLAVPEPAGLGMG